MPVEHFFKDNLVVLNAEGEVGFDEFHMAWKTLESESEFQPPVDALIDLREALVDMPGEEIDTIVSRLNSKPTFNKLAIVAPRGSFTYAIGRMFCFKADYSGFCSDIFLDISEATAWLLDKECAGELGSP